MASDQLMKDRISNLPQDAIDAILVRMPLKDAIRTSILSRYWRHKWTTIPDLVLHENTISSTENRSFSDIVYWVFLLHRGPIRRLDLRILTSREFDLDVWIRFALRKKIKELILTFKGGLSPYQLPSCLYSCETIIYLDLYRCIIHHPCSFVGFKNLKTLVLRDCLHPEYVPDILHSSSIEKVVLDHDFAEETCIIRAPKLVELDITARGLFILYLEDVPLLSVVCIKMYPSLRNFEILSDNGDYNLASFLGFVPCIQELKLLEDTLQMVTRNEIPRSIHLMYQLRKLVVSVNFEDSKEVLAVLLLVKSSPLLLKLEILVRASKKGIQSSLLDWEEQERYILSLNTLRVANFFGLTGINPELKFIEYLLANTPVVEIFDIQISNQANPLSILKALNLFKRCSSNARVVIEGILEEESASSA